MSETQNETKHTPEPALNLIREIRASFIVLGRAISTDAATIDRQSAQIRGLQGELKYLAEYANGETIASTLEFSHIVTKARGALAESEK